MAPQNEQQIVGFVHDSEAFPSVKKEPFSIENIASVAMLAQNNEDEEELNKMMTKRRMPVAFPKGNYWYYDLSSDGIYYEFNGIRGWRKRNPRMEAAIQMAEMMAASGDGYWRKNEVPSEKTSMAIKYVDNNGYFFEAPSVEGWRRTNRPPNGATTKNSHTFGRHKVMHRGGNQHASYHQQEKQQRMLRNNYDWRRMNAAGIQQNSRHHTSVPQAHSCPRQPAPQCYPDPIDATANSLPPNLCFKIASMLFQMLQQRQTNEGRKWQGMPGKSAWEVGEAEMNINRAPSCFFDDYCARKTLVNFDVDKFIDDLLPIPSYHQDILADLVEKQMTIS